MKERDDTVLTLRARGITKGAIEGMQRYVRGLTRLTDGMQLILISGPKGHVVTRIQAGSRGAINGNAGL